MHDLYARLVGVHIFFCGAAGICSSSSTYVVLHAAFSFRCSCITLFRTPGVSLLLFALLFYFFFFRPSFSYGLRLVCCVIVPGALAFHLPYLDELIATVWFTLFHSL